MTKELGYHMGIQQRRALEYFKILNYRHCRINAYPPFTEFIFSRSRLNETKNDIVMGLRVDK